MIHTHAVDAMATRFELALEGDDAAFLADVAEEAGEAILECHGRFNRFDSMSLVSFISRTAHERPVQLDVESFELFELALRVGRESEGAFDIAIGDAMCRAGFDDVNAEDGAAGRGSGELTCLDSDAAGGGAAQGGIHLDRQRLTIALDRPGVELDLGAIAKGFALDRAAEIVRGHGVSTALLHGGTSSVLAIGRPEQSAGFRVRLAHADGMTAELADQALGVSAPHGRMLESSAENGASRGHVLDPRTGESADALRLAAVIAPTAAEADAWSTAIVAAGRIPDAFPAALSALAIDHDGRKERRGAARWLDGDVGSHPSRNSTADQSAKAFSHA